MNNTCKATLKQANTMAVIVMSKKARIINKYIGPLPAVIEYKIVKEDK